MKDQYYLEQSPTGEIAGDDGFELRPRRHPALRVAIWLLAILLGLSLVLVAMMGGFYALAKTTPVANDSGRVNMLIMGIDRPIDGASSTRADSIIIASLDLGAKEPQAALVSLPRDLWLPIPGFGEGKINGAFAYGEIYNFPGGGAGLMQTTIEENFDLPIHYTAVVDFAAFAKIVDGLGGVTVTVEEDLFDPYYPTPGHGFTTFQVRAGSQEMDGETALKYARSRMTTNDFDRARRQQQLMLAIKQELEGSVKLANPRLAWSFVDILATNLDTNLTMREAARLALALRQIENGAFSQHVLSPEPNGLLVADQSFGYVLVPRNYDYSLIADFLNNIFLGDLAESNQFLAE